MDAIHFFIQLDPTQLQRLRAASIDGLSTGLRSVPVSLSCFVVFSPPRSDIEINVPQRGSAILQQNSLGCSPLSLFGRGAVAWL